MQSMKMISHCYQANGTMMKITNIILQSMRWWGKYDAEHSRIYDFFCVPENHAMCNSEEADRWVIFSIPIFETLIIDDDFPKFPTDY